MRWSRAGIERLIRIRAAIMSDRFDVTWKSAYNSPPSWNAPIRERYERSSILLTSNRAPEEWPDLLGSPLLASAGLDRLTHHAHMIVITGTSFRARGERTRAKEVPIEPTP